MGAGVGEGEGKPRRRAPRPVRVTALVSLLLAPGLALAEGPLVPPPEPPPGVRVVADLEWGADTVVLEPALLAGGVERDDRIGVLRFPRDRAEVARLEPGQIVVFRGVMMRRVKKVGVVGEAIRLETEEVPLTAALRNARISMEVPMGALVQEPDQSAALAPPWPRALVPGTALLMLGNTATPVFAPQTCSQATVATFDVEACLGKKGGATDLEATLKVTKKHAGQAIAEFTAEGTFGAVLKPHLQITNHRLTNFDFRAENFHSEFKFKATALGPGGEIKLELPPILEIPFLVGGAVPVVFKLTVYTSLETILPDELASVNVDLGFKFGGDYGFSYTGGNNVSTFASNLTHTPALVDDSISAENYTFVKFNVGVPRIEFGIFGSVLVPWFQNAISIAGYYTGPFHPASCRELKVFSVQAAGYDFGLLGFSTSSSRTINKWPDPAVPLVRVGQCD